MRQYELALVVSSKYTQDQLKELKIKITDLIKGERGEVTKEDSWPLKVLAYPINKEKEAQFLFLNFEAPTLSKEFSQKIKLTEGVLRYLLLRNSF